jgi:hypothetical protein
MKPTIRLMFLAPLVGFLLGMYAASAFAQTPSTPTTASTGATSTIKAAPLAEGIYQVQAAPDANAGQAAVVVAVELPPTAKLPAMVRIPVPQGGTPTWVGEILGGDPTADLQRPYRMAEGTGGQVLEVTIEQTRTVQAEFAVPSTSSGGQSAMTLTWIQASPSTETQFSVRTPAGSSQVQITPTPEGTPATNGLGESLYALPTKIMKPGETSVVTVSYVSGQSGPTGQTQPGTSTAFYVIVVAFVLVLAVLGFLLISRRSKQS